MIVNTTFTARGDADPRVAELSETLQVTGVRIRLSIDVILYYEDRGYTVDLETGLAEPLIDESGAVDVFDYTPAGKAVGHLLSPVTHDEIEQTIDGLFDASKDEDCAPDGTLQAMIDDADDVDAYALGKSDYAGGRYCPPFARDEHVAYIKGQNDAWADAKNITWWRRSER